MNFDLHRPCASCPFRTDKPFFLPPERRDEIATGLESDMTFSCHMTNDFCDEPEDCGCEGVHETRRSQHCAGAMIVLEKMEMPNQLMRICERIGLYDRDRLVMDAPVFDTLDDFREGNDAQV